MPSYRAVTAHTVTRERQLENQEKDDLTPDGERSTNQCKNRDLSIRLFIQTEHVRTSSHAEQKDVGRSLVFRFNTPVCL